MGTRPPRANACSSWPAALSSCHDTALGNPSSRPSHMATEVWKEAPKANRAVWFHRGRHKEQSMHGLPKQEMLRAPIMSRLGTLISTSKPWSRLEPSAIGSSQPDNSPPEKTGMAEGALKIAVATPSNGFQRRKVGRVFKLQLVLVWLGP